MRPDDSSCASDAIQPPPFSNLRINFSGQVYRHSFFWVFLFVLGLDVGKSERYACLLQVHGPGSLTLIGVVKAGAKTAKGHAQLLAGLTKSVAVRDDLSVVMESTRVSWERGAMTRHDAGDGVSVVNAAQMKFFAKRTLRSGKTDKLDAELIARSGAVMQPVCWLPPEAELIELRALLHARDTIVERLTLEAGRHHAVDHQHQPHPRAIGFCEARQKRLEQQLEEVNGAVQALVLGSEKRQEQVTLLASLPGIGPLTASILLVERMHLSRMESSNQWAASAGLSPVPRQSGSFPGRTRISKRGNGRLRRAFYRCALTASRMKNTFGDFYRHLIVQGKPKKVALIALARKLLRVAFAVLKSGQNFNPDDRRQPPVAA
ncbi:IS110 family transposase [Deinococcus alpinitundrae]|uniref:IS110 family transposase n=1 Tax=Deinococcus alpinitundrae TaxID=468913 RepID=UPI001ED95372|nr:IS110 family transposase [Deinococcus alpinitundrae]